MSDSQKMAVFNSLQQQQTPQTGMQAPGMLAPDTQGLPPPVARMQGGFGLNPQMLGLLQQVSKMPQAPQAAPMQQPFTTQSRPQQRPAYGPGNWSR